MFQVLAGILAFFYGIIPDYSVAIALLTLTVMVVLSPLTLKSTRSMLAMQRLQPEIKRIQQKYKGGDTQQKQQMQQEMMALYKEHRVNPMSGCLPMLVQAPVLFVMYHVIRGLTQVRSAGPCPGFDPKYLDKGTRLFQDLCHSNREMNAFGMDLAKSASQVLKRSATAAIPFLLLTAMVAFVQFYQSRQMTRRNPQGSQSPQVQMMTKVIPVMFGVFSFAFPAALNVYWLISGLFRVGQQGAMYRWDPTLVAHVRDRAKEVEAKAKDKADPKDKASSKERAGSKSNGKKLSPRARGNGAKSAKTQGSRQPGAKSSGVKNSGSKNSRSKQSGAGQSVSNQSGGKQSGGKQSRGKQPGASRSNGRSSSGARNAKRPKGGDARSRKRRTKRGR